MGRERHWSTPGPCPTRRGGGGREMLEYVLWDMSEPGVEDADLHSRL